MIIRHQLINVGISGQVRSDTPLPGAAFHQKIRGSLSGTAIASYLGVFLLVVALIAVAYHPPVHQTVAYADASLSGATNTTTAQQEVTNAEISSASSSPSSTPTSLSVDQLVATNIASSLAVSTDMPISNNVANLSQSLQVESTLAQTADTTNTISKPQIVQPTANGRVIQQYATVQGDTVQVVAQKYNVTADTIRWANNLTSDALAPGTVLSILPVSGVLYTVKNGDTLDSISAKYGTSRAVIVSYNDLDLSGDPTVGTQLILPGGTLPNDERPGYVAPTNTAITTTPAATGSGSYSGGYASSYYGNTSAGNRYAWGNCTWYAYERRMQLGRPVGSFWGNASTWAYAAQAAGYLVDGTPSAGAVMQNGGGYGHVAIVESVNPGVSITISEMNAYRFGGGFARVDHGTISWSEATSGYYKYIH